MKGNSLTIKSPGMQLSDDSDIVSLSADKPTQCDCSSLILGLIVLRRLRHGGTDKIRACLRCSLCRCNMSTGATDVFNDVSELEIFSLVTGCVSVLAVLVLAIVVIQLNASINKLKKQVSLQTHMDQHSFYNPTIQPEEELAKRGYSMYNGVEDDRPPNPPEKEEYFGNFSNQPRSQTQHY